MNKSEARVYSTNQVANACGVTLRQLQWWAEKGVVSPRQIGHQRVYTAAEVTEISVIAELRRKGYSLQSIRRIMRAMRKKLDKCLTVALANSADLYLLVGGHYAAVYLEYEPSRVVERLKSARQPMSLVCIADHLCWLESAARGQHLCARAFARFSVISPHIHRLAVRGLPGPGCGVWSDPQYDAQSDRSSSGVSGCWQWGQVTVHHASLLAIRRTVRTRIHDCAGFLVMPVPALRSVN